VIFYKSLAFCPREGPGTLLRGILKASPWDTAQVQNQEKVKGWVGDTHIALLWARREF
jgi:hypothetical protein